jgi:cytochrome b6-f complex iron-sulfur subunit
METNDTSRRDLLQLGVTVGAASLLGGCKTFGLRKADVVAQAQDNKVTLGKEESSKLLASEGSLLVEPKGYGVKILVVRAKDSSLHAISAICTHMGCTVLYDQKLGHIRCPCHGSQYGLDGHNLKGPAQRPLKRYDVRAENSLVVIALKP